MNAHRLMPFRLVCGRSAHPECPGACFVGPGGKKYRLQFEGLPENLVYRLLFSQKQLDFYGGVFDAVCECLAGFTPYVVLG